MIPCKPTACDDRSRLCRAIVSSEAQARHGATLTPALSLRERGWIPAFAGMTEGRE